MQHRRHDEDEWQARLDDLVAVSNNLYPVAAGGMLGDEDEADALPQDVDQDAILTLLRSSIAHAGLPEDRV